MVCSTCNNNYNNYNDWNYYYPVPISSLQANLVQNGSFETNCAPVPCSWWNNGPVSGATFTYPTGGRSGNGVSITNSTTATGYWAQSIAVSPSTSYILSGYIATQGVTGQGAAIQIDWLTSVGGGYISTNTAGVATSTTNWTPYTGSFTSPANAGGANIILALTNSTGTAVFDDVSLTAGGGGGTNNYCCQNGQCVAGCGSLPAGCNNTCTPAGGNYCCQNGQCVAGCGSLPAGCNNTCTPAGTTPCPSGTIGLGSTCIKTMYIVGAAGALVLLMMLKR